MRATSAGLVLAVLLSGCPTGQEDPVCVHDPPLTYDNFGRGFMDQFCNGCHSSIVPVEDRNGAPLDYDFDSYEGVVYWADKIKPSTDNGVMPPGGGPTEDELATFDEWMHCQVMPDNEQYWFGAQ